MVKVGIDSGLFSILFILVFRYFFLFFRMLVVSVISGGKFFCMWWWVSFLVIFSFVIFGSWIFSKIRLYLFGVNIFSVVLLVIVIFMLFFSFFSIECVMIMFSLIFLISRICSVGSGMLFLLKVFFIFFVIVGVWIVSVKVDFLFGRLEMVILLFIFFVSWWEIVSLILVFVVGLLLWLFFIW